MILLMTGLGATLGVGGRLEGAAPHLRTAGLYWKIAVGVDTTVLVKLLVHRGHPSGGRGGAGVLVDFVWLLELRMEEVIIGMRLYDRCMS